MPPHPTTATRIQPAVLAALARRANRRILPGRLLYGPDWVILGVNNACNLRCRMCDVGTGEEGSTFHHHMTGAEPRQMPEALARRVVAQVARHFPKARLGFAFTEPTAWSGLVPAVRDAHQHDVRTALTTNGLLLPGLAVPLAEAGLDTLVVSIDGPPAVHDTIRRREGSFARAIEGIRAFAAARPGHPDISVYCAITEWNLDALAALVAELTPLPLRTLGFMHTVFVNEAAAATHNRTWGDRYPAAPSNTRELRLENYDLDELWRQMQQIQGMRLPFEVAWSPTLRSRAELEAYYRAPTPFGRGCADVFTNLMVKSDGTVIPAHSRCYDVVAGNLHDTELDMLWNAPALARLRRDLRRAGGLFPGCSRCCSAR